MLLNKDLSRRTLVHAAALDWMPSPAKGVDRRMLFRIGEEKARATSPAVVLPITRIRAGRNFWFSTAPSRTRAAIFQPAPMSAIRPAAATRREARAAARFW